MSLHFTFMVLYAIFVVISMISLVIPVISVISVNRHTGKNRPQIMNFWREFLTVRRQGKSFQFGSWISICRNRTCKNFENRSKTNVFMSKKNFEYGFCISRGDKP